MITPRTQCIINHVSARMVADVGTDHAYIPIALIERGLCDRVIASDIRQGPVDIAKRNVEQYGFSDKISVRLGGGLLPISNGECEECIIAGMGGNTIINILEEKTLPCRYIFQPMNCQYELRRYLYENGFKITKEDIATEGFKVYNVICAERGEWQGKADEIDFHIPKEVWGHQLIGALIAKKRREFEKIKTGIEKSEKKDMQLISHYEMLLNKLSEIKKKAGEMI